MAKRKKRIRARNLDSAQQAKTAQTWDIGVLFSHLQRNPSQAAKRKASGACLKRAGNAEGTSHRKEERTKKMKKKKKKESKNYVRRAFARKGIYVAYSVRFQCK
jgi:hypothetical protein